MSHKLPPEERLARARERAARYRANNRAQLATKQHAYAAQHRDEILEKNKTPAMRTYFRERARKRRQERPEDFRLASKRYRERHPEKVKAAAQMEYATHPERPRMRAMLSAQKRRAHKLCAPRNDLTHAQWLMIQGAQDHRCAYCGKRCKGRLTQDHITPLSQGGSHTLHNVIGACKSCNSRKHAGPPPKPVQPLLL